MDLPTPQGLFGLEGKRAMVTGASRGIGLAIAAGLAGAGAEVAITGREAATLEEAAAPLRAQGATIHTIPFDASDADAGRAAVARFEDEIGPMDILVNNAGMQIRGAGLETWSDEDWESIQRLNVDSLFWIGSAAARAMLPRGSGCILNVCSVLSFLARPAAAPYAASKAAAANLTRGMAADWSPRGIRVNGLAPGYVRTELTAPLAEADAFGRWLEKRTPMARWGEIEDMVGPALFLCSPAAGYVTGHILAADGGLLAVV